MVAYATTASTGLGSPQLGQLKALGDTDLLHCLHLPRVGLLFDTRFWLRSSVFLPTKKYKIVPRIGRNIWTRTQTVLLSGG